MSSVALFPIRSVWKWFSCFNTALYYWCMKFVVKRNCKHFVESWTSPFNMLPSAIMVILFVFFNKSMFHFMVAYFCHVHILVSNQYTLYDLLRFSHSDCGSLPVKTCANKWLLLEEKKWHTLGLSQQPLDYRHFVFPSELRRSIGRVGLNFY